MTTPAAHADWRKDVQLRDEWQDTVLSLADVLVTMRNLGLGAEAAFVEWLADDWYAAKEARADA